MNEDVDIGSFSASQTSSELNISVSSSPTPVRRTSFLTYYRSTCSSPVQRTSPLSLSPISLRSPASPGTPVYDGIDVTSWRKFDLHINQVRDEQERVQQKVFMNWINHYVPNCIESNIIEELRDGTKLIALINALTGESIPAERGRRLRRHHYLSNVQKVLDYLELRGLNLINIHALDIVDGNPRIILGLIWIIILCFHIEEYLRLTNIESNTDQVFDHSYGVGSTWQVPPQTLPRSTSYSSKGVVRKSLMESIKNRFGMTVTDFGRSWRDGHNFLMLIDAIYPQARAVEKGRAVVTNRARLKLAFDLGHKYFGVKPLLDPEDIDVPNPDERSIMTYVTQLLQSSMIDSLQRTQTSSSEYVNYSTAPELKKEFADMYETSESLQSNFSSEEWKKHTKTAYFVDLYMEQQKRRDLDNLLKPVTRVESEEEYFKPMPASVTRVKGAYSSYTQNEFDSVVKPVVPPKPKKEIEYFEPMHVTKTAVAGSDSLYKSIVTKTETQRIEDQSNLNRISSPYVTIVDNVDDVYSGKKFSSVHEEQERLSFLGQQYFENQAYSESSDEDTSTSQQTFKINRSDSSKVVLGKDLMDILKNRYGMIVTDFGHSWRDGENFLVLLDAIYPQIRAVEKGRAVLTNRARLKLAFDLGHKYFGVKPLLDAEDIDVPNPEEISIITYVTQLLQSSTVDSLQRTQTSLPEDVQYSTAPKLKKEYADMYETETLQSNFTSEEWKEYRKTADFVDLRMDQQKPTNDEHMVCEPCPLTEERPSSTQEEEKMLSPSNQLSETHTDVSQQQTIDEYMVYESPLHVEPEKEIEQLESMSENNAGIKEANSLHKESEIDEVVGVVVPDEPSKETEYGKPEGDTETEVRESVSLHKKSEVDEVVKLVIPCEPPIEIEYVKPNRDTETEITEEVSLHKKSEVDEVVKLDISCNPPKETEYVKPTSDTETEVRESVSLHKKSEVDEVMKLVIPCKPPKETEYVKPNRDTETEITEEVSLHKKSEVDEVVKLDIPCNPPKETEYVKPTRDAEITESVSLHKRSEVDEVVKLVIPCNPPKETEYVKPTRDTETEITESVSLRKKTGVEKVVKMVIPCEPPKESEYVKPNRDTETEIEEEVSLHKKSAVDKVVKLVIPCEPPKESEYVKPNRDTETEITESVSLHKKSAVDKVVKLVIPCEPPKETEYLKPNRDTETEIEEEEVSLHKKSKVDKVVKLVIPCEPPKESEYVKPKRDTDTGVAEEVSLHKKSAVDKVVKLVIPCEPPKESEYVKPNRDTDTETEITESVSLHKKSKVDKVMKLVIPCEPPKETEYVKPTRDTETEITESVSLHKKSEVDEVVKPVVPDEHPKDTEYVKPTRDTETGVAEEVSSYKTGINLIERTVMTYETQILQTEEVDSLEKTQLSSSVSAYSTTEPNNQLSDSSHKSVITETETSQHSEDETNANLISSSDLTNDEYTVYESCPRQVVPEKETEELESTTETKDVIKEEDSSYIAGINLIERTVMTYETQILQTEEDDSMEKTQPFSSVSLYSTTEANDELSYSSHTSVITETETTQHFEDETNASLISCADLTNDDWKAYESCSLTEEMPSSTQAEENMLLSETHTEVSQKQTNDEYMEYESCPLHIVPEKESEELESLSETKAGIKEADSLHKKSEVDDVVKQVVRCEPSKETEYVKPKGDTETEVTGAVTSYKTGINLTARTVMTYETQILQSEEVDSLEKTQPPSSVSAYSTTETNNLSDSSHKSVITETETTQQFEDESNANLISSADLKNDETVYESCPLTEERLSSTQEEEKRHSSSKQLSETHTAKSSICSDQSSVSGSSTQVKSTQTLQSTSYPSKIVSRKSLIDSIKNRLGINVTDFGRSWSDGQNFLTLIDSIRPQVKAVERGYTVTNRARLKLAFDLGHKHFGVKPSLDAEDIDVPNPDERLIMTYVAQILESAKVISLQKTQTSSSEHVPYSTAPELKDFGDVHETSETSETSETLRSNFSSQEWEKHTKTAEFVDLCVEQQKPTNDEYTYESCPPHVLPPNETEQLESMSETKDGIQETDSLHKESEVDEVVKPVVPSEPENETKYVKPKRDPETQVQTDAAPSYKTGINLIERTVVTYGTQILQSENVESVNERQPPSSVSVYSTTEPNNELSPEYVKPNRHTESEITESVSLHKKSKVDKVVKLVIPCEPPKETEYVKPTRDTETDVTEEVYLHKKCEVLKLVVPCEPPKETEYMKPKGDTESEVTEEISSYKTGINLIERTVISSHKSVSTQTETTQHFECETNVNLNSGADLTNDHYTVYESCPLTEESISPTQEEEKMLLSSNQLSETHTEVFQKQTNDESLVYKSCPLHVVPEKENEQLESPSEAKAGIKEADSLCKKSAVDKVVKLVIPCEPPKETEYVKPERDTETEIAEKVSLHKKSAVDKVVKLVIPCEPPKETEYVKPERDTDTGVAEEVSLHKKSAVDKVVKLVIPCEPPKETEYVKPERDTETGVAEEVSLHKKSAVDKVVKLVIPCEPPKETEYVKPERVTDTGVAEEVSSYKTGINLIERSVVTYETQILQSEEVESLEKTQPPSSVSAYSTEANDELSNSSHKSVINETETTQHFESETNANLISSADLTNDEYTAYESSSLTEERPSSTQEEEKMLSSSKQLSETHTDVSQKQTNEESLVYESCPLQVVHEKETQQLESMSETKAVIKEAVSLHKKSEVDEVVKPVVPDEHPKETEYVKPKRDTDTGVTEAVSSYKTGINLIERTVVTYETKILQSVKIESLKKRQPSSSVSDSSITGANNELSDSSHKSLITKTETTQHFEGETNANLISSADLTNNEYTVYESSSLTEESPSSTQEEEKRLSSSKQLSETHTAKSSICSDQSSVSGSSTQVKSTQTLQRSTSYPSKIVYRKSLMDTIKNRLGINVTDFGRSWSDGQNFLTLIDSIRPQVKAVEKGDTVLTNRARLKLAFDLVQKHFGVKPLLDAEDIDSPNPNERSIMTYVAQILESAKVISLQKFQISFSESVDTCIARRGICAYLRRAFRRSLPLQVLLLLLIGAATLIPTIDEDYTCVLVNNLGSSFEPVIDYPNGAPPV